MKNKAFGQLASTVILVLLVSVGTLAANDHGGNLAEEFNDFTPAGTTGPWELHGQRWLKIDGESGKAAFSAVLTMEKRSDLGVTLTGGDPNNPASRHAHTHHVIVSDATVQPLAKPFRVSGPATVTRNGNFPAADFGPNTTVQIDVIGGNTVSPSNIKLTFIGDAASASHFGTQTLNGVGSKLPMTGTGHGQSTPRVESESKIGCSVQGCTTSLSGCSPGSCIAPLQYTLSPAGGRTFQEHSENVIVISTLHNRSLGGMTRQPKPIISARTRS